MLDMPLMEISGLERHYDMASGVVKALDGIDLEIEKGERIVLLGPSGSGKSTLLNLIGGLDQPSSGSVEIEGTELATMTPAERSDLRRDRLGFVFQAYNLIPVLTAAENTEFVLQLQGKSATERRERAVEMLAAVGLEGMENRRPHEMSGGQQQRVAVARAIAADPALVLADEPTANLDSTTSDELIATMKRLNSELGVTFVFATHDPKVMDAAQRVIRLVDGEIAEDIRK